MDDEIESEYAAGRLTSVLQCFDEKGQVIIDKYLDRRRILDQATIEMIDRDNADQQEHRPPRTRSCKKKDLSKVCDNGQLYSVSPTESTWYMTYVNTPMTESADFHKTFRYRFIIPFGFFQELSCELKTSNMFQRWCGTDAVGSPATPIELLLLGTLRILSRDLKIDDIHEYSAISLETHRQFFHVFIRYGSTVLYNRYIKTPRTKEELLPHMQRYARKGLHGAVGSVDGTHIASKRIPNVARQAHSGYKLTHTSRAFNMTVNNTRQILHTTTGSPARWNDKTLAENDSFYQGVKKGEIGGDIEFELFYFDEVKLEVAKQKYSGVWLLADNGYNEESCAIPPYKTPLYTDQYVWSEWLESTRKDVERSFGILKGRFLIFTSPIRFHGVAVVDRIWLTCCALHNYLLTFDYNIHPTDENYLDLPDASTMRYIENIPADFLKDQLHDDPTYRNGCGLTIPIKKLQFETFRSRLVRHFAICKCNGLAVWDKETDDLPVA